MRESYVNLCSNVDDKLKIYRENFERAYLLATESFYKIQVSALLPPPSPPEADRIN